MASSSLMQDSRALEIDAFRDGRREDEQTQVGYLFRSLCFFFFFEQMLFLLCCLVSDI